MTENQMMSVRAYGVYDVGSQQLLSGDSLCNKIVQTWALGIYPDDPSINSGRCFYGGQADPTKGDCAAKASYDRRICPCSQFGETHI